MRKYLIACLVASLLIVGLAGCVPVDAVYTHDSPSIPQILSELQDAKNAALEVKAKLELFNTAEVFAFPSDTASVVVLRAGIDPNTFGTWAEIVNTAGVPDKFSDNFTAEAGYVEDVYIYGIDPDTQSNSSWLLELGWGDNRTTLGRFMFHIDVLGSYYGVLPIKSRLCPKGEKIYYRLMSTEPGGSAILASFRFFYNQ